MSHLDLFVSQSNVFSGIQTEFEKAKYVVFGVPFDVTSTYRTGARFGPTAIRQASLNIETYSFRSGMDIENVKLHDLGDLNVSADPQKTIDILKLVVEDIRTARKIPVAIGGEHTITLGIMKGLTTHPKKTVVVSFDAHLDLREEFMGLTLSHTTFMQLINEEIRPGKIVEIGTRGACKDELAYARKTGIHFVTSHQIRSEGTEQITRKIKQELAPFEEIYLSVDLDVLDPAFAPAVQNPEPEGIDLNTLLEIACGLCDERIIGFDVLEIAPVYDQGVSAIVAARTIFEILCQLEKKCKPPTH
jgi:agmatinase